MCIEQAIHRGCLALSLDEKGNVKTEVVDRADELQGGVLGYRCMHCRYPDNHNADSGAGFRWQTLEDVLDSGAVEISTGTPPDARHCMVCHPDGRMEPLVVETARRGRLTPAQRRAILAARSAPEGCILLTEQDSGIKAFSTTDWAAAEHVRV